MEEIAALELEINELIAKQNELSHLLSFLEKHNLRDVIKYAKERHEEHQRVSNDLLKRFLILKKQQKT